MQGCKRGKTETGSCKTFLLADVWRDFQLIDEIRYFWIVAILQTVLTKPYLFSSLNCVSKSEKFPQKIVYVSV